MVETRRLRHARLFDLRLLHHYWLDEGTTPVDAIADPGARARRLLGYDVRRLLTITPSRATAALLAGVHGVFKATSLGCIVAAPDDAALPLDAALELFVTATAPDYAAYTALSLRPQPTVTVTDPATARVHRYRANVPVLSNLTGASRGTGAGRRLFLSQEYVSGAAAGDAVEALVTVGPDLRQLTGDPPGAPFHVLGPRAGHPVYVHQGDVPPVVPPAGSTGAPARGVELADDAPPAVAAVIRIAARRADDDAFSIVDAGGRPRATAPVFEVHLRNRWTTWRYRKRGDGSVTSTEAGPLPLTWFGNAGTRQKPAPTAISVERGTGNPPSIARLMSDIYV